MAMRNEFTAVIERDGDWYIAYCLEIPGANGQGQTIEECRASLADAIALIGAVRRWAEGNRSLGGMFGGDRCLATCGRSWLSR
jgi:hypothetical protein